MYEREAWVSLNDLPTRLFLLCLNDYYPNHEAGTLPCIYHTEVSPFFRLRGAGPGEALLRSACCLNSQIPLCFYWNIASANIGAIP
jgi:hypothetical protein